MFTPRHQNHTPTVPPLRPGVAWVASVALAGSVLVGPTAARASTDSAVLELPPVISIATKSTRTLSESPLPATVIGAGTLERRGMQRLSDVLGEETGLVVVHDHGTGVQVQGLSPAYTLILLDGEPAVGRNAGTLELDRFVVGNLERVEMIKGPSSSLYGSEALGGVINLVTRKPVEPFAASVRSRYATHNTLQLGATAEAKRGGAGLSLMADRSSSDGYELTPLTPAQTAPAYENHTVQAKLVYEWDRSTLTVAPRWFGESQRNAGVYFGGSDSARDTLTGRDRATLLDLGVSSTFEHRFTDDATLTTKGYATRYKTASRLRGMGDDTVVSEASFDQRYYKAETYGESRYDHHTVLLGGGAVWETAVADRVEGGERSALSGFAFGQEEWRPAPWASVLASARLDAHRDYATSFSPRVAGMLKPASWLSLRASAGRGFKAPTFQQLYMDFTNPQVGYSVFGAANVNEALSRLESQGQLRERVRDIGAYTLRPEYSWSYNAGVEAEAGQRASARANVFLNNVHDLIEAQPVAAKTNGQSVYTYFNVNRIRTWGLETEGSLRPAGWLKLSAGYQFLVAEDLNVLDSIANGTIYKVGTTGVVRPVQRVEYGGLFNRSRHTANVKADVETGRPGFAASLRGMYRGRYGYADDNGNGILDRDSEYIPGHMLWNVSASQKIGRFATLEAGVDNLFDYEEPLAIPTLPTYAPVLAGRRLYAGFRLQTF